MSLSPLGPVTAGIIQNTQDSAGFLPVEAGRSQQSHGAPGFCGCLPGLSPLHPHVSQCCCTCPWCGDQTPCEGFLVRNALY